MPKIIKLTWPSEWPIFRQTPGQSGIWEDYQFVIDSDLKECDFWVVYEDLKQTETVKCPVGNQLFFTAEPSTVKGYNKKFLQQFKYIITSQPNISHPGRFMNQQALSWHVGRKQRDHFDISFSKDYDELVSLKNIKKTKLASVIVSSKEITQDHSKRLAFFNLLKAEFKDDLDFFGRGSNEIEDKWDAIAPYKYHIVLENSSHDHYWTEKLADTYLGGAYPIYFGAPNIKDYFPVGGFSLIDINDPAKAVNQIRDIIYSTTYEDSCSDLEKSRKLILDQYNLFPFVVDFINKRDLLINTNKIKKQIYPLSHFTRERFTMHNLRVACKRMLQFLKIMK